MTSGQEPRRSPLRSSLSGGGDLKPATRETLGELALLSERYGEIGTAISESRRMLVSMVERHPEFKGASSELLAKVGRLEDLMGAMAHQVTGFAHQYEDVAVSGSKV